MRIPNRSALLVALLALGGCSAGERGMSSPHQPLVTATSATVPNCPDWSDTGLPISDAQGSNFGCATAVNLAAMVADPADLLHGKQSPTDAVEVGVRAIRAWRQIEPTSKQWTTTTTVSTKGGN